MEWFEFYTCIFPSEKSIIKNDISIVKTCQTIVFSKMAALNIDPSCISEFLKQLFDKFDSDQSGSIDVEEFTNLIRDITGPQSAPTDKDMRIMFAAIDFDKGGGIDFSEFLMLLTPPRDRFAAILKKSASQVAATSVKVQDNV